MKVTIKDIARETGLSTATVSKYLNHIKIQENNRKLIEDAIQRLGYQPNRSAQMLRSKKTHTIGVLISDLGNYFWGPVIGTVSHYFTSRQYTVITCSYNFDKEREKAVIQDIISQNFEGLVMLPFDNQDYYYHLLQDAGIPVVLLDQLPVTRQKYPVDCVLSDNYNGCALLAEHLFQNGHTDICILNHSVHSYTVATRVQAVLDIYRQHGLNLLQKPYDCEPIIFSETQDVIFQNRQKLLKILESPAPPTAVFFTNYLAAMGGLSAINSAKLNIPGDISLVCFDYDPLFRAMHTSMTCVAQDLTALGNKACEILLRRISGDYSDFPCTEIINVQFHSGKSVRNLHAGEKALLNKTNKPAP